MQKLLSFMLLPMVFSISLSVERVSLCKLLDEPNKYAGKFVEVKGYIKPIMHGTYLKQDNCEQGIMIVLPEEIPHYKGTVVLVKDSEYEFFKQARYNFQSKAPRYSAVFTGILEYRKHGKGFGYYKNHRVRLVLQSVTEGVTEQLSQPGK
jgi:hypothetical protein